jgi:Pyruvate/2-oxoacid:ferredoxin oxidoreductase delta subunit
MSGYYQNFLMIYYSGTGNSRRVSEWLADNACSKGMNTHLCSFDKFDPEDIAGFEGNTLIGFFSATHGFNMPHSMLAFLFRFKVLKGSDVFIGNTRAGMKLWKLFMPGLSGLAMYFPALIMLFKGYKVRAMYPVDLPSNWISLHPGLRKKVIDSMVDHYKVLTTKFGNKVFDRKSVFLKSFILLPLDMLVAPIALGYYFVGRYILAKTFIANYKCNTCGICIEQCPTHSIVLNNDRPYWKFTCESCMHCMNYCPQRAIETAHSFLFLILAIFIYILNPIFSRFSTRVVETWLHGSRFADETLYFILQWVSMLFAFWIGYRLLHYALRFPTFNKIITYTTFSTWKFWRRYHIPKDKVASPK